MLFQEKSKWQVFKELGFISCVAVGDILNQNLNSLVVVTTEGWCYVYNNAPRRDSEEEVSENATEGIEQVISKCSMISSSLY